mgnify:CR=1 FL=1
MENSNNIPQSIGTEELLYRGVVENQWDAEHNRPSSATFKDSKGASVDRDAMVRDKDTCVAALLESKSFKAICRVKESDVEAANAITKYLPVPGNDYHCEIHDSEVKITLSPGKAKKVRDSSEVVYLNTHQ